MKLTTPLEIHHLIYLQVSIIRHIQKTITLIKHCYDIGAITHIRDTNTIFSHLKIRLEQLLLLFIDRMTSICILQDRLRV